MGQLVPPLPLKLFFNENSMYYNKQGKRVSKVEYNNLFSQESYRRVDLTEIGSYIISTIWLGSDHSEADYLGENGVMVLYQDGTLVKIRHNDIVGNLPLFFETIVFKGKEEVYSLRTSTLEQAQKEHEERIKVIKRIYQNKVTRKNARTLLMEKDNG